MEPGIADYALIGDSSAAALVCRNGSIDWCCLPEFDSPAIFAALLDRKRGGSFAISPKENYECKHHYVSDTNVLETYFTSHNGEARLTDAFTAMTEDEKTLSLFPEHELLRMLEGISGSITFRLEYTPKVFYGRDTPTLVDQRNLGVHFSWKEHSYVLLTTLPPEQMIINGNKAIAEFVINAGERHFFSLSYSSQRPAVLPELAQTGWTRMEDTIRFWRRWIAKLTYNGLYLDQVKRSALVLKLLTHAPSGAIIAAPTTSLPEKIGQGRNWDYRYCWLRDASFTTRVLVNLGFEEEVHAYMNWILHATQLTRPKLNVVYSVYGHTRLKETILDWLSGYKNSLPVRIGNEADKQFQLDVYGEVLDAIYTYSPLVKSFDRDSRKFITGLGNVICEAWDLPDNGIWEIRSSRVHHTHSKVMAWVGLDRLIRLVEKYQWKEASIKKYRDTAQRIRLEIETFGYNTELKTYTRDYNGSTLDASALTFSLVGYTDPTSERMVATVRKIAEQFSKHDMVYRYLGITDGIEGNEGAFGICNFWLAENLAKSGQLEKAREIVDATIQCAGPSGLLSEEIEPATGELLGNYPQSFTHIGLINAVLAINEQHLKHKHQLRKSYHFN